jgi:hypothetical protein
MRTGIALSIVALVFIGVSLLFAARLGVEADEALIANGMYPHGDPWYSWTIGRNEIPVMLISYLGALKVWLVHPWLDFWGPGRTSLRFPAMVCGAITIWLFFLLLDRIENRKAAWIGVFLLLTDPSFLLIDSIDWGFVSLQFVFKLGAILLLVRFRREGNMWLLAWGFFLFGLALWDKTVFLWALFGLGAGALIVFPKETVRHFSLRNVIVAGLSAGVGALPLVVYNIARPLETLRANGNVSHEPVLGKAIILWRALDGAVLFGFMTSPAPPAAPGAARHWYQSLALRLSDWTGHPQQDLMLIALAAAVLSIVLLWRTDARRPMLFALVASGATWLAMAVTQGAGAAAHHVILLWPFPWMIVAIVLGRLPQRAAIAATAILCLSNAAVMNNYYAEFIRNGPSVRWTDALDPLEHYLVERHAENIYIADWGIQESLNLLSEGSLPIFLAETTDEAALETMFASRNHVFVAHSPGLAFDPQERTFVESVAARHGWTQEHLETIYDQYGRPTFDLFRFRKIHL